MITGMRNKPIIIKCEQCGKETEHWPCRIKKNKHNFCSQKCFNLFTQGPNHYRWKNGIKYHDGYIMIKMPNHPNAKKSGYIMLHRLIMSEHLGRPLKKNEDVHHINGDITDNRIKNLKLFTHGQHTTFHNRN
jgi:hypothetical protein